MARRKKGPQSKVNAQWNAIKPFVSFRFDGRRNLQKTLSSGDKQKIKRYFEEINSLTAQPTVVKRPRNPDRFKAATQLSGQNTRLKDLKVVFVPFDGENAPKLKYKRIGGKLRAVSSSKFVDEIELDFNKAAMARDGDTEVMRVANLVPDINKFRIKAGKHEIPKIISRNLLPGAVTQLQTAYSIDEENPELLNNGKRAEHHNWELWLDGLIAAEFSNQQGQKAYTRSKQQAKRNLKKKRRAKKRRTQRQLDKKR